MEQIRKQSALVRHEDLSKDKKAWLVGLRDKFMLTTKPGFPDEVQAHLSFYIISERMCLMLELYVLPLLSAG